MSRELNRQLQEANACKDKFFSIIAHDLRAPFTGLLGLTEALVEEFNTYSEDHIKKIIRLLHDSSEKVYTLLENLLTWSRLQRGLIEQVPEDIPMARIVEIIVRLFASHAGQKQVTIKSVVPQHTTVYADRNMLNTILRNLISNALKFTDAQGVIEVSATSADDVVEIAVSDTGIGMSAEQQAKLFRIDAQSSTPGTAGEKGTGLGLMLCQELIEQNGGTIRVESEVGKGTTFFFTIPKKPANTKN